VLFAHFWHSSNASIFLNVLQIMIKHRYRPGTKALMEIRKYQKSTAQLIQRAPFVRLVKDLVSQVSRRSDLRIQADAVSAIQEVDF
jgi:hypothetical protein